MSKSFVTIAVHAYGRLGGILRRLPTPVLLVCMALAIPLFCLVVEIINGTTVSDSSVFRYLGWRMTIGGGRCYVDAWDNTGPVLALFNAIGYLFVPMGNIGPSVVFAVVWMLTAILSYRFMCSCGKFPAALSSFLCCMFGLGVCGGAFMNCREGISIFFASVGLCFLFGRQTRMRCFLYGACVGFSFMNKANLLGFGGAAVLLWIYDWLKGRDGWLLISRCAFSFLGFASVLLAITLSYLPDGVFPMWDAALFYNLFERISNDSTWLQWWIEYFKEWSIRRPGGWVLPLFALMFATSILTLKRLRGVIPERMRIYLSAWLGLEVLLTFAFKSFFEHYLIMAFLPIAMILALGCKLKNPWPARITVFTAVVLFSVCLKSGFTSSVVRNKCRAELYSWVAEKLGKNKYVATFGGHSIAEFLSCAGMKTKQRYFAPCFYLELAKKARKDEIYTEFIAALEDSHVDWLVVEPGIPESPLFNMPEMRRPFENFVFVKGFPNLLFFKRSSL